VSLSALEPSWLVALRTKGQQRFDQLGWPTTRDEDWKYTSIQPLVEARFADANAAPGASTVSDAAIAPYRIVDGPTVVLVNGVFDASRSSLSGLPAGVTVRSLRAAWAESPALVESRLGAIATDFAINARNTAGMQDGVVIHVPADIIVEAPIHVIYVADAAAAGREIAIRNLIVLEHHAKATVIETYAGVANAKYFTNTVTEADIADGATLTHIKLQREASTAYHYGHIEAKQARDSHFVSFSFAIGGQLARTNVYTFLGGAGCGATLNGLYLADGTQHIDHQTRIEHVAPNCYSRELYKGVLEGEGHGVFNGKVYVWPEAQKTDGKQENHTLLLSDKAKIDTKPQLEIFADDVKCTHGATVGRIDQGSLFYMKSRGIGAELARQLLVYAFAADVIETLENTEVREALERLVLARFTKS
jgi:Fe-S cluster assembly protein SufD